MDTNEVINDEGKQADLYEQMQSSANDKGATPGKDENGDDGVDKQANGKKPGSSPEGEENGDDTEEPLSLTFDGQPIEFGDLDVDDPTVEREGDTDDIKALRAKLREANATKAKEPTQQEQQAVSIPDQLPPPPQIGDDGIDWDETKHREAMDEWLKTRDAFNAHQAKQQARNEQINSQLNERLEAYKKERVKALKVPGFEHAEKAMNDLPQNVQIALMLNSKNQINLVAAVGSNAKLRKELADAASDDPVKFGYMIADIDRRAGKAPSAPSSAQQAPDVRGGKASSVVLGLDAAIEQAREKGDYTTVIKLKKQQKAQNAKK